VRPKFRLTHTECRRCGKPLLSGNRSLYGNDAAKGRLDRICDGCTTPQERAEIERATCPIRVG
jgi:hypothetical protein